MQSATNCTNAELQTSEFNQKFQHRPVCKTNLGALSAKAPTLQGRLLGCWPSATFHNFQQGCQSAGQGCKKMQPANLPSFNTLARVLATCYKTSTTKLALPAHCPRELPNWVPAQNCKPLGKPAKAPTLQGRCSGAKGKKPMKLQKPRRNQRKEIKNIRVLGENAQVRIWKSEKTREKQKNQGLERDSRWVWAFCSRTLIFLIFLISSRFIHFPRF